MSRIGNYKSKLVDMELLYFQKNTSELRRGNYILQSHLKTVNVVLGIKPDFILTDCKVADGVWVGDMLYAPIPLTEQWLLRGGFVKKENKYESTSLCLIRNGLSKTDWFNVYSHISGDFYSKYPITTVTYVHQLQNLHFALTGQELEFKD